MRQMLDFVLSYVASFDGGMVVAWDVDLVGIDPDRTVSALSKLFRRACHGSPASRWTPIVLPLVACLTTCAPEPQNPKTPYVGILGSF